MKCFQVQLVRFHMFHYTVLYLVISLHFFIFIVFFKFCTESILAVMLRNTNRAIAPWWREEGAAGKSREGQVGDEYKIKLYSTKWQKKNHITNGINQEQSFVKKRSSVFLNRHHLILIVYLFFKFHLCRVFVYVCLLGNIHGGLGDADVGCVGPCPWLRAEQPCCQRRGV